MHKSCPGSLRLQPPAVLQEPLPQGGLPHSSYTEALARLEYGIGSEDFLLLTGPVGVGKSVALLGALIHSLDPNAYTPIYIRGNNLGEGELYKAILAALDRDPPRYTQPARRMFFSVVPELSRKPIALIDDAQEMKDAALLSLKSLANFDSDSQTRITFILSGQPELRARLKLAQYLRPQTAHPPLLPHEAHEPGGNLPLHRPPHPGRRQSHRPVLRLRQGGDPPPRRRHPPHREHHLLPLHHQRDRQEAEGHRLR